MTISITITSDTATSAIATSSTAIPIPTPDMDDTSTPLVLSPELQKVYDRLPPLSKLVLDKRPNNEKIICLNGILEERKRLRKKGVCFVLFIFITKIFIYIHY